MLAEHTTAQYTVPHAYARDVHTHASRVLSHGRPPRTFCAYVLPAYWSARMLYDMTRSAGLAVRGRGPSGQRTLAEVREGAAATGPAGETRVCG